jgi:hypothetical protein
MNATMRHEWWAHDEGRAQVCAHCGVVRREVGRTHGRVRRKVYAYSVPWPGKTDPLAGTYLKVAKMPPCKSQEVRELRSLLREAANAIWEELYAAGEDEVRQHPTLSAHAEIHAKIAKYLGFDAGTLP